MGEECKRSCFAGKKTDIHCGHAGSSTVDCREYWSIREGTHGGWVKVLRVAGLCLVFAATRPDEISLGESAGQKAKWSGDRDH